MKPKPMKERKAWAIVDNKTGIQVQQARDKNNALFFAKQWNELGPNRVQYGYRIQRVKIVPVEGK